jgi:hypothetical protein
MTKEFSKLEKAMMNIDPDLIRTDDGLVEQIEKIISDEQSRPLEEQDTELIEEAVDMILSVRDVDTNAIDTAAKEGAERVKNKVKLFVSEQADSTPARKNKVRPRYTVYLKRIAIIFLSIVTVTSGLLLTNTKVRAAVKQAVVEFFGQFVKINLSNSDLDNNRIIDIEKVGVNYIPDGFSLENYDISPEMKWLFYSDGGEGNINITINKSSDTEINVDNELTGYERFEVNGYEAYILYDEADQTGTVVFGDKNITITVSAVHIEKEDLLKIAENIQQE